MVQLCLTIELSRKLQSLVDAMGKCQRHLLVLIKASVLLSDQVLDEIEVEVEMCDRFACSESEGVIHPPAPQPIVRSGGRYFEGITECHRRQPLRLPMKPDLRTEPIVSKVSVGTCRIRLGQERRCVPAQLNVTK